jgi:two-component system OmpR family response regulator
MADRGSQRARVSDPSSVLRDEEVFDRSIDVQILRLRCKLEIDPIRPELIKTERGVGYVFAAPVQVF